MNKEYDILLIGAGISSATIAASLPDKKILVLERGELGGMARTEEYNGIDVHKYGPHVFHTSNSTVWEFMNRFATFNGYIHRCKSMVNGIVRSFPVNLSTYNELYNMDSPEYVKGLMGESNADNFEDYLIEKVGPDIYDKFYKGYWEKLWGMPARHIPLFIAKRIPIRTSFNDLYFNDLYQGVPIDGYTAMIEKMFERCDVMNVDFMNDKDRYESLADVVVYTGSVDEYFDYSLGVLPYRSMKYYLDIEPVEDFQGTAQMNYCDERVPFTRKIEHKHFNWVDTKSSIVTIEYPKPWYKGSKLQRFYPIPLEQNEELYASYIQLDHKAYFAGRLGKYKYMDMDQCVEEAMYLSEVIKEELE